MLKNQAIGRLVKDPELKTVSINGSDISVCKFSIAVDIGKDKTEFVECSAWRQLGETIGKHFTKGRRIYVEGQQNTRKYPITKDGVEFTAYATEWNITNFEFVDNAPATGATPEAATSSDGMPF